MHIEIPHRCGRTHGGYQSLAECNWPDAAYVVGDGPFALLARCDLLTVSLYESDVEARRRLRAVDARGCGKTCEGLHELIGLVPGAHPFDPLPRLESSAGSPTAVEWLTS
jgi:hypothetical protein